MRPPVVFPENTAAVRILKEFHRLGAEFAVVVDEYGSLEGIVTMGDLAGTVLGEEEPTIVERAEGDWLGDRMIMFDQFLDHFPLADVEAHEYETLAGFLINQLGRLPRMAV